MLINELGVYPSTSTLYENMCYGLCLVLLLWQLLAELETTVQYIQDSGAATTSIQHSYLVQLLKLLAAIRQHKQHGAILPVTSPTSATPILSLVIL